MRDYNYTNDLKDEAYRDAVRSERAENYVGLHSVIPLSKCPFCGSHAVIAWQCVGVPGTMGHSRWYQVQCAGDCGAKVEHSKKTQTPNEAADAWNRRVE